MSKKINISIIVDNDVIWNLPVWEKTIPILNKNNFNVKSIIVCEEKLASLKGFRKLKWYLLTFGFLNFLKLSLYAIVIFFKRQIKFLLQKKNRSFYDLSKQINSKYYECSSPNEKHIKKYLTISKTDIILLMSSHILQNDIINIPSIGIINKHASALPSNKGLFPYFWSVKNSTLQGISFHKVNSYIDNGQLIFQKLDIPIESLKSMISFYIYVFDTYPSNIIRAIKNLINKKYIKYDTSIQSSYNSIPNKKDYDTFIKNKGIIIDFKDILYCIQKL
jgi:folate-dependent phosphoribosylglycinamide formyltransferase PurN